METEKSDDSQQLRAHLINLYLKLPNGEMLETQTDMVNYADDFVTIKGGINIPTWIISDVDA